MKAIYVLPVLLWLFIVFVTVQALETPMAEAGSIFMQDLLAMGWRAQFSADFLAHLLIFGCWVFWREGMRWRGALLSLLCLSCGGLFSMLYLLLTGLRCRGDLRAVLIGPQRCHFSAED